ALDRFGLPLPLAEMGWQVYMAYQRGLAYRGAVDFQDLIRLAVKALEQDERYLSRLQYRWKYILEDEAQDSSQLQETILRKLAGSAQNWVRMGDPNQAIYETFTTAKPEYLRAFMTERGVTARELPNSGRSTKSIIRLANALIDFSARHPSVQVQAKQALQPPKIEPTLKGDPQPNPPDAPDQVAIRMEDYTPEAEIEAVARSAKHWLLANADKTLAILVPRNDRGALMAAALKRQGVEVVELLRSTSSTRETAGALALIFDHLSQPINAPSLAAVYTVWRRDDRDDADEKPRLQATLEALKRCKQVEDFVQPQPDRDWLATDGDVLALMEQDEVIAERLVLFRALLQRWHKAALLPVDQLILTLAQDLFSVAADLAIAYSLAVLLRRDSETHPEWRLPQFKDELTQIARNKRRVTGMSAEDSGFDSALHRGKATVATLHRAKGLEWDRVYLTSVNNYDFPSNEPQDSFISEKWFVRDGLNLQAEALAQLKLAHDPLGFDYQEGIATEEARIDYVAERLRLLYVGMTRARHDLIITWNTGRDGKKQPATPLIALQAFWEQQQK
ncbi:MAG: ATP-dependent helicase, partial [Armatimonadetes bacterium]|nr:ATP-dependent helicase [Anaerolineae bacterium]